MKLNQKTKPQNVNIIKLVKNTLLKDIITSFPFLTGILIYSLTLRGCYLTQYECLKLYPIEFMKYVIMSIFVSGLLLVLQVILYIKRYTDFKVVGLQLVVISYLCFIFDTGTDFISHGAYNRFILFISLLFWSLFLTIANFIYCSIKRRPVICIIIIVLSVYVIWVKVDKIFEKSCDHWYDGLKGTKMSNEDTICIIEKPTTCYYKIFDGVFDVSRLLGDTCANNGTNKLSNIVNYLTDKSSMLVGYPRTEKWPIFPDSTYGIFNKKVMSNVINMENPKIDNKIKDDIEVTTNFYKNPPEVNINLKRNEELAKQRKEIFETKSKDKIMAKNVIHLFIDSISRVNFKLKMPKFHKWIEKFYSK